MNNKELSTRKYPLKGKPVKVPRSLFAPLGTKRWDINMVFESFFGGRNAKHKPEIAHEFHNDLYRLKQGKMLWNAFCAKYNFMSSNKNAKDPYCRALLSSILKHYEKHGFSVRKPRED